MHLALVLLALVGGADAAQPLVPGALASPACVACAVDGENALGHYSRADRDALLDGRVVAADSTASDSDDEVGTVEAAGIIHEPPARVWATLVDFPSRPRFQPGTQDVHVVRVDGNRVWVAEHLRFFLVDVRYVVVNTLDPVTGRIAFALDESVAHDIGGTRGSWQLTPLADGNTTLLTYRAWVDTGRHLPTFVQQFLLRRSLPALIGGVRDEVERRAGAIGGA